MDTPAARYFHTSFAPGDPVPGPDTDGHFTIEVADGPDSGWTTQPRHGWIGRHCLRFASRTGASGPPDSSTLRIHVLDVTIPVAARTRLSYMIHPRDASDTTALPHGAAVLDLEFSDGTLLSESAARTENGFLHTPEGFARGRVLFPGHWNSVVVDVGDVAAGKEIRAILIAVHDPEVGQGAIEGWIDDITIDEPPAPTDPGRPSEWVDIRRGTNSSAAFSRGNCLPAVAVPHGANFWIPVTDAGSPRWPYHFQLQNDADGRPRLQALALSHQSYPWGADRHTFQVMPTSEPGLPHPDRIARSLAFQRNQEVAHPHHYSVTFENGLRSEITPTLHGAAMRFAFPGDVGQLVFDNIAEDSGGASWNPALQRLEGVLGQGSDRMFLVGEFDQEVARAGGLQTGRSTGYCRFATSDGHSVVLRLATSRIGLEQAAHHLRTELPTHRNFDDLLELAAEAWDDVLGVIDQVEGASHDQLVTLYSCLYRMNLYQTIAHESLPDEEGGGVVHASPFLPPTGAGGSDLTSAPVVDGPLVRSSGFWDTYRTTWPALALLYPESTARLADGVLTQFREATWFGTGMVGSCADASFAEMVAQGASDFDVRAAYDVLIQHASVVSPRPGAGRPRMNSSVFLGYTPLAGDREHDESLADFLENCLGDFAIGRLAATLYERTGEEHFRDEHRYFTDRSLRYVNVFDPDVDFFQGRHQDGAFRVQTTDYDPAEWGYDYTETNGWGMAFAVPHDGAGLAALYGGKEALASKLDTFFSTPELSDKPGSYGQIIHEIREAASIGQGQWGFSNQPGFHIPYMYLFAGRPQDTQRLVRHTLARQFAGSAIGQGYPGDEDTGSMSAWFFLSALGLYPLRVGSGEFVIGSPLFSHARVHLGTDAYLTVRARNNAPDNVYVQSLHVNGEPYDKTWLPHELFSEDLDLEFEMGPEPSDWGSGRDAAPPSVTPDGGRPRPMRDLTGPGLGRASIGRPRTHGTDPLDEPEADLLFDNTSDTSVSFQNQADITVTWSMARTSATRVQMYTLTSVSADTAPSAWELHGSRDANEWVLLDSRRDESFHWDRQTRPFRVEEPGEYRYYRWTFHASLKVGHDSSIPMSLAQLELLG